MFQKKVVEKIIKGESKLYRNARKGGKTGTMMSLIKNNYYKYLHNKKWTLSQIKKFFNSLGK